MKHRAATYFCNAFTGCDNVSLVAGHEKSVLFDKFCSGDIGKCTDIFLDLLATKDTVIINGIDF